MCKQHECHHTDWCWLSVLEQGGNNACDTACDNRSGAIGASLGVLGGSEVVNWNEQCGISAAVPCAVCNAAVREHIVKNSHGDTVIMQR